MPSKPKYAVMSFAEIGRHEGVSRQAAEATFKRGLKKLRGFKRAEIVNMMRYYANHLEDMRAGTWRA